MSAIEITLQVATVFPDYNRKSELADDHETSIITVQRMKHKHFRKMQSMPEEKQLHYLMSELTGLSDKDLDELDAEDSVQLARAIFKFMKGYAEIAKEMMGNN